VRPTGSCTTRIPGEEIPEGQGHFGHRPGFEWWRTQQLAREQGWTREQLIEYENDPTHYWYEDPSSNAHRYEAPR
jgi:HNH/ENDO VII superfamily nuclease